MPAALPGEALQRHLAWQARQQPDALAVFSPVTGPVTYAMLTREIDGMATALLEQGLEPGMRVALQLETSHLHLLLLLACDRLEIATSSFAPDVAPPSPARALEMDLAAILSERAGPASPPCRWISLDDGPALRRHPADAARLGALAETADPLLRVMWSSGTTGGAKGIPWTRAVLARRIALRRLLHGLGPRTRALAAMPLATSPGYLMALGTLAAGGLLILPDAAADLIGLANALQATATSATPAMLEQLLTLPPGVPRRFETLDYIEVPGAHLPAALAAAARLGLTPRLIIDYGTTESGRIAAGDAAIRLHDPSAVGPVIPWIEAEIVDADDRPLPRGREGVLRVRGAQLVKGYLGSAAATRRNFRDGWFHPGDVAAFDADGMLRVTGRIEDHVVRDGRLESPLALEEAIRALPGVRDVAVFPLPQPDGGVATAAALVLADGAAPDAVRAAVVARLGAQAPGRLVIVDALPRNANGKVVRRALVERALDRADGAP